MGNITQAAATQANAPAVVTPKQTLTKMIESNKQAIGLSLPKSMDQDRFARLLLTAANTTPALFDCDPRSFLAAGVTCAQLGLEPNDPRGLAYLIPFNDKRKGKVVNLIIGYRGMLDLARRSGQVSSINAFPVFKGDRFEYRLGLDPHLEHHPGDHDENPQDLTHVYAVAKVNGDPQFVVLTRKQIDKTKASSMGASSQYSPWNTHYVEMALKTALRRLCKWLPQTVEVAQADVADGRSLTLTDMGPMPDMEHDAVDVGEVEHTPDDDSIEATLVD